MSTVDATGIGDIPVVRTEWRNVAGALETPGGPFTSRYLTPSGASGTPTPAVTGTGITETTLAEITKGEAGRWYFWIDGNGVADAGHFDVDAAPAAP